MVSRHTPQQRWDHDSFRIGSITVLELSELCFHCEVTLSQFLDCQVIGFVVGKTEISFRTEQRVLGLLKMVDGFVDLINGCLKFLGCQFIIPGEASLERLELVLEVRDINVLFFYQRELCFVLQ